MQKSVKPEHNLLQSSPEARGERVKRLRNLSNLSRQEMCEGNDLNVNTLKGWEIGRYGGLTVKGADKLLQRVAQEGVICNMDWLLYEIGSGPSINSDYIKTKEFVNLDNTELQANFTKEDKYIAEELMLFRSHYKHTVDLIINDDGMLPIYQAGDYVAGVPYFQEKIANLIGENCIVQTASGHLLVRQLRKGNHENAYNLICINTATSVEQPVMYNVNIISAAPITWQRRKHG